MLFCLGGGEDLIQLCESIKGILVACVLEGEYLVTNCIFFDNYPQVICFSFAIWMIDGVFKVGPNSTADAFS